MVDQLEYMFECIYMNSFAHPIWPLLCATPFAASGLRYRSIYRRFLKCRVLHIYMCLSKAGNIDGLLNVWTPRLCLLEKRRCSGAARASRTMLRMILLVSSKLSYLIYGRYDLWQSGSLCHSFFRGGERLLELSYRGSTLSTRIRLYIVCIRVRNSIHKFRFDTCFLCAWARARVPLVSLYIYVYTYICIHIGR